MVLMALLPCALVHFYLVQISAQHNVNAATAFLHTRLVLENEEPLSHSSEGQLHFGRNSDERRFASAKCVNRYDFASRGKPNFT
jgi:hypothetical protein